MADLLLSSGCHSLGVLCDLSKVDDGLDVLLGLW